MTEIAGARVPDLVTYVRLDEVKLALEGALEGETLLVALQAIRREEFEREAVIVLSEGMRHGSAISRECEVKLREVILPIWETLRGALRRLEGLSRYVSESAVTPPAPTDVDLSIRLREALQTTRAVLRLEGAPDDDERLAALESLVDLTEAVPVALEAEELLRELCDELKSDLANLRQLADDRGWEAILEEDREEIVKAVLRCLAGNSGRTDEGDYRIPPGWAIGLSGLPPQLKDDLMRLVIADQ